ncbi:hypothetical protein [Geobacter sp. SVR]|uniref:hypothetical protein n=1 Tax=Geobacter sp. SVR TaxID=2495594 RepID=UPI00143F041E|nr:hypothetical protein [Geobacter sp. SVR]BCS52551.1 hypothetical protein GSVR_08590 [Geobacter sp. SVR]GCF84011.1 hypothetical protein GSbR_06110 [Geobacter sp. SVR]
MAKLNDKDYDIVSVIYHSSQAAEICSKYVQDAAREGDKEAEQFFHDVQDKNESLVARGKDLLRSRM